mmetsp:Transcript_9157/g.14873  ORF Transcript_9157/g.14873 Transcript_9157/m.14873 type:complete len:233 (+) Transcript_9157:17-715(+)
MDAELERGLRDVAELIQRKVVEPYNRRESMTGAEKDDADRLEKAMARCPKAWGQNLKKVLYSEEEIDQTVRELAWKISKDYAGKEVVVVGILKGAVCFMADLLKHLTCEYKMDFMMLSSYGSGTKSSGTVVLKKDLEIDPAGRHILIVEDLIDTGGTLTWLQKYLESKNPKSVKLCTLLDKKAGRDGKNDLIVHYSGRTLAGNDFVIGYGMDFNEDYRALPFIGVLKEECYQ